MHTTIRFVGIVSNWVPRTNSSPGVLVESREFGTPDC